MLFKALEKLSSVKFDGFVRSRKTPLSLDGRGPALLNAASGGPPWGI